MKIRETVFLFQKPDIRHPFFIIRYLAVTGSEAFVGFVKNVL